MKTQEQKRRTGLANITETASYLGISDNSVRKLITEGKLPHEMVGSHRRIPWTAIYKFAGEVQEPAN